MELIFNVVLLLLIYTALMVVVVDHPINALLFLIGCFINSSVLLLFLGLEFIALIFVAIYIGAIAIFFLFTIMMMNIPSFFTKKPFWDEYVLGLLVLIVFFFLCHFFYQQSFDLAITNFLPLKNILLSLNFINTLESLGLLLYTHFAVVVVVCGFLLFFAMIASVMLLELSKKKVG